MFVPVRVVLSEAFSVSFCTSESSSLSFPEGTDASDELGCAVWVVPGGIEVVDCFGGGTCPNSEATGRSSDEETRPFGTSERAGCASPSWAGLLLSLGMLSDAVDPSAGRALAGVPSSSFPFGFCNDDDKYAYVMNSSMTPTSAVCDVEG